MFFYHWTQRSCRLLWQKTRWAVHGWFPHSLQMEISFSHVCHSVWKIMLICMPGLNRANNGTFFSFFLTACEEVREAFQTAAQTLFQLDSVVSSVHRSAEDPPYYSAFPQYEFPQPVEKCSELSHRGELSLNQWALLDSWRIRETRTPLRSCLGQQSLIHMDFWGI